MDMHQQGVNNNSDGEGSLGESGSAHNVRVIDDVEYKAEDKGMSHPEVGGGESWTDNLSQQPERPDDTSSKLGPSTKNTDGFQHTDSGSNGSFVGRNFVVGCMQVMALLRKNLLTKYRTPSATVFELFSPLMMMLILAAAYTLSEITYEDARQYTDIQINVPGPWTDLLRTSLGLLSESNGLSDVIGGDRDQDDNVSVNETETGETVNNNRQGRHRKLSTRRNSPKKNAPSVRHWHDIASGVEQQMRHLMEHRAIRLQQKREDEFRATDERRFLQSEEADYDDSTSEQGGIETEDAIFDLLTDAQEEVSRVLCNQSTRPTTSLLSIWDNLQNLVADCKTFVLS